MTLFSEANSDNRLIIGKYLNLAGICNPVLNTITDLATPLKSGQGVNITNAGVVSLATDNETHVIVGGGMELQDGTFAIKGVDSSIRVDIQAVEKGLVRIVGRMKAGETIVVGDEVSFDAGELVLTTAQTNSYIVEDIQGDAILITFK